ncbi:hypothetical protein LguiA_030868 [Lonicera macranthoides]
MFPARVLVLTLTHLFFFLHHSMITFAVDFPTPNSPAAYECRCLDKNLANTNSVLWKLLLAFGRRNAIATVVIILITLLNIAVYKLRKLHEANLYDKLNEKPSLTSEQLCRRFSLFDIISATNNFDDALIIGQGGFGKVYKGIMDDGAITVAIKRLNPMSKQGAPEFWTEIDMLSKIRHSHIVSLIGYCDSHDEMILIYEYMVRGTLAEHLYTTGKDGRTFTPTLSWVQRLKICIGAAHGLDYLHTGTGIKHRVIHRDVKSSNILLDENWAAKISDFGLSKIGPTSHSCSQVSTKVKGTFGYLDPEYFLTHRLTRKSDVYAFGVVLFEVLCGRRALDVRLDVEQRGLAGWAQHCIKEGTLDRIIDPFLRGEISSNSLSTFVQIADQCLHIFSKKRPSVAEVVASLESALALQEREDSAMFNENIFTASGVYDLQKKIDSSIEKQELMNDGNGGLHNDIIQLGDTSGGPSRVKTAKIMTFRRMVHSLFLGIPRMNSVHSDPKRLSKNSINSKKKGRKDKAFPSKDADVVPQVPPSGQISTSDLKIFTLDELKTATRNFNTLLGKGDLGDIFLGWVNEVTYAPSLVGVGMAIAVKKLDPRDFQRHLGGQIELRLLGRVSHPNLASIRGYCMENQEFFVVYEYMREYMQNGSLKSHLFREDVEPLSWFTRLKIAIGAARGLAFFHTMVKEVIYNQFQTSCILLDGVKLAVLDFNVKLWNFEFAGAISCSPFTIYVPTRLTGKYLYRDPEYWTTGSLTMKSDVYGFGLVLLELLTGLPTFDNYWFRISKYSFRNRKEGDLIFDERRLKRLMDERLNGEYPLEGALQYVLLVQKCLVDFRSINRPTMEEVLNTLEHINGIKMDPNGNSAPVGSESKDLQGDDRSTKIRKDLLSVEMPRYRLVESSPNSYSVCNEDPEPECSFHNGDMELSGPR